MDSVGADHHLHVVTGVDGMRSAITTVDSAFDDQQQQLWTSLDSMQQWSPLLMRMPEFGQKLTVLWWIWIWLPLQTQMPRPEYIGEWFVRSAIASAFVMDSPGPTISTPHTSK